MSTRELNEAEKGLALTVSAAVHYLIRRLDDLRATSLFSQRLKQTGKSFQTELEKHARQSVWHNEVEGADINVAAEQLDNIATMMHNLMIMSFGCSELQESDQHLMWVEMNKVLKRFNMPIKMRHDGTLEFKGREVA